MEKTKLLQELDKLKRLINDHESKQAQTLHSNRSIGNKTVMKVQPNRENKSSIFVNPKKLNAVNRNSTFKVPDKVTHTSKLVAKVFINPNFRKQSTLAACPVQLETVSSYGGIPKPINHESNTNKVSFSQGKPSDIKEPFRDLVTPQSSQHKKNAQIGESRASDLPVAGKKPLISNNRIIFINRKFSVSTNTDTSCENLSSQMVMKNDGSSVLKSCVQHVDSGHIKHKKTSMFNSLGSSNTVVSPVDCPINETKTVNLCGKRKVCIIENNMEELPPINKKIRKEIDKKTDSSIKIFFNPNFERKESDSKTFNSVGPTIKVNRKNSSIASVTETSFKNGNFTIPVLTNRKEQSPNKFMALSYPVGAIVGPDERKPIAKKITNQRIRTRSASCLVSISATKLIRKRKLSRSSLGPSEKISSDKPLFVSKNKLVRSLSKKAINTISKLKLKQDSPKIQIQCLTPDKLLKLRRRSFTDRNLPCTIPKSAVVTKIKSKNGKSLKLIRKNLEINKEKERTHNIFQNRKTLLKEQACRIALCLVQNKLKKNQFSKINVPVQKTSLQSSNNRLNIYKKTNISPRTPLTKAALVAKKEAMSVTAKLLQFRNTFSEKTKFIKSKYRLIRKLTSNNNKYRLRNKNVNMNNPVVPAKKLKWKSKNIISRRRLTRKDLSIKKIGGVFYRYSRTTLTKNKQTAMKNVPQQQRKCSFPHARSKKLPLGSKHSQFCIDRRCGRKRINIAGITFTTSPSGMSWRRTNHNTARSILMQAKQKRIHQLSKRLKKNNEPCLFFHRYGHCSGYEHGTCVRSHDRKFVAVCKKYVQGMCTDTQCRLNHEPSSHNMPTCHHFLAGQCGRDNCPYPHVKVNDSEPICLQFLKGFCPLGDQCIKRHFEMCPSFEKGTCARGKYCPYPHPKTKQGEKLKGKFKHIKRKPQPPKEVQVVSTSSLRYFEDVNLQKENEVLLDEDKGKSEDSDNEGEEISCCLKNRPKLGRLPSFIPLNFGSEVQDL